MKTLLLMTTSPGRLPCDRQQQREAADESPRLSLFERALNADVIDYYYLQSLPVIRRFFYRWFPSAVAQALEGFRKRHDYDVVVTWSDHVALIYAFLLKLTRSRVHHVAILSWMAVPKKALILNQVQEYIDRSVVWSQSHKALLVEFFDIAPSRLAVIPYFVDQQFWRPIDHDRDSICSAGDSRRDYATLVESVRDLPLTCRIATQVRPSHQREGDSDWGITAGNLYGTAPLPANVVIKPASHTELREIYARSHFVVVPLFQSFRDHGNTTIAEAMAMGKAVICSHIQGQADSINDGQNGIFVPPSDPQALRKAILYLLEHPDIAARMGDEGRRRAEQIFALDRFVENIRRIANDVIKGTRTPLLTGDEAVRLLGTKEKRPADGPLPSFLSGSVLLRRT